jgi:hypothetical protein
MKENNKIIKRNRIINIVVLCIVTFLTIIQILFFITIKETTIIIKDNNDNKVFIAWHGVSVPLGYITLIRDKNNYGAVKLTQYRIREWHYLIGGPKQEDILVDYESYYQGDGNGDFSNKNVIIRKGEVSDKTRFFLPIILSGHSTIPIGNPYVRCGPLKVLWTEQTYLWFNRDERFDIERGTKKAKINYELAPTKWKDISEVNVFDSRIKWYRPYEVKDNSQDIPIDKLWEDKEIKF